MSAKKSRDKRSDYGQHVKIDVEIEQSLSPDVDQIDDSL